MVDFRRKMTGKVNAIGRRFFAGDIVEKRGDEFFHYYIDGIKDSIELMISPSSNIDDYNYEMIFIKSEDIEEA